MLGAALWTIAFTLLFFWLLMFATANALQPPASYVQYPAKCQAPASGVGRYP